MKGRRPTALALILLFLFFQPLAARQSTSTANPQQSQDPKPEPVVVPSTPRRGPDQTNPQTRPQTTRPAPRKNLPSVTIPEGTALEIRLTQSLSSKRNVKGDDFEAIIDREILVGGQVVVAKGSRARGRLTKVKDSGRIKGRAQMSLELLEVYVENEPYPVRTNPVEFEASGSKKSDAKRIGVAAGIGALIGGIIGGGGGAAVGAAIGGAGGAGAVLVTKGDHVELRSERLLSFRLETDLRVHR